MCGIFLIKYKLQNKKNFDFMSDLKICFNHLGRRGQDASGIVLINNKSIQILKSNTKSNFLINSSKFKKKISDFKRLVKNNNSGKVFILGHTRMVTRGNSSNNENNQPIINEKNLILHNGIITNYDEYYKNFNNQLLTDVDSEIYLKLLNEALIDNKNLENSLIEKIFKNVKGANSFFLLDIKLNKILFSTTNNSLHRGHNDKIDLICSEKILLNKFFSNYNNIFNSEDIITNKVYDFQLEFKNELGLMNVEYLIKDHKYKKSNNDINEFSIKKLELNNFFRCKKCILPNTFPFITFDNNGVCNFCNNDTKKNKCNLENLKKILGNKDNKFLIPLSGGRDSSYVLHYIVKELGYNAIAYTYDWGFITDIARKNISNICGKLDIEHIIVSADIRSKRLNVFRNLIAWMQKPNLGLIPLFTAGDKQFFYFANKIKIENKCQNIIFGQNDFEETNFKSGFIGINDSNHKKGIHYYNFDFLGKIKILIYYAKQFLINPRYFNSSMFDSFTGYLSYYFFPKKYIHFYDYIDWNEEKILNVLKYDYDWKQGLSQTAWRIGDSTTPFYNYIYLYKVGFTENDTFRSRQIRANQISREEALEIVNKENLVIPKLIKQYSDTVGLNMVDFNKSLEKL